MTLWLPKLKALQWALPNNPGTHSPWISHECSLSECQQGCPFILQKQEFSGDILTAMEGLKQDGGLEKWGSDDLQGRVNVFQGELKKVGVKNTGICHLSTLFGPKASLISENSSN